MVKGKLTLSVDVRVISEFRKEYPDVSISDRVEVWLKHMLLLKDKPKCFGTILNNQTNTLCNICLYDDLCFEEAIGEAWGKPE